MKQPMNNPTAPWKKVHHEMAVAVARHILKELKIGKGIGYAESMQVCKALVELDDRGVKFPVTPSPAPDAVSVAKQIEKIKGVNFIARAGEEEAKTLEVAALIETYATTIAHKAREAALEEVLAKFSTEYNGRRTIDAVDTRGHNGQLSGITWCENWVRNLKTNGEGK